LLRTAAADDHAVADLEDVADVEHRNDGQVAVDVVINPAVLLLLVDPPSGDEVVTQQTSVSGLRRSASQRPGGCQDGDAPVTPPAPAT
jgi:hypothetical protein